VTSTAIEKDEPDQAKAIHDYATRLHSRMVYAWAAAQDATLYAQAGAVSDTTRTKNAEVRFEVGNCRDEQTSSPTSTRGRIESSR